LFVQCEPSMSKGDLLGTAWSKTRRRYTGRSLQATNCGRQSFGEQTSSHCGQSRYTGCSRKVHNDKRKKAKANEQDVTEI
jgi:hypothetical protein